MSQMNLFGGPDSEDNLAWETRCVELFRKWPRGKQFTSDDFTAVVGLPPGDHNQVGSVIRGWHDRGLIEWTGQTTNAARGTRHSGLIRIWRKL